VSATVLTAKNSRPVVASAIRRLLLGVFRVLRVPARGGAAAVQAEHAEHGAERDLAEAADGGLAQRLLELRDRVPDVLDALALLDPFAEHRVGLRRADATRDALAARLVAEEPEHVRPRRQ